MNTPFTIDSIAASASAAAALGRASQGTESAGPFAASLDAASRKLEMSQITAGLNAQILESLFPARRQYASDLISSLFPASSSLSNFGAATDRQYKTLGEVFQDFRNDFSEMSGIIGQLFAQSGFTLEPPLSMGLDGVGGVTTAAESDASEAETGTESEAAKAATLFKRNSPLVNQFALMAARGAISEAAAAVPGFASAYQDDPAGAIRNYIDPLEDLLFGFRLTAGGNGIGYHF